MPPVLRKRKRLMKNPSSTGWFDLPFEMREMVIDQMDPKTRCIFSQCSKLCEKEVKESKNYLCNLKIEKSLNRQLYIGHDNSHFQFCLEFVDVPDLTYTQSVIIYKTTGWGSENTDEEVDRVIKWMEPVCGKAEEVRKEFLNDFLERHKKSIKHVIIEDEDFSLVDVKFHELRNLTYLQVHQSSLEGECLIRSRCLTAEKISKIGAVIAPSTNVKFEDIVNFRGHLYHISSNDFTEEHIKKYLKMWKNGELFENLWKVYVINWEMQNVNKQSITEGLDAYDFEETDISCRFRFELNYYNKEEYYAEVQLTHLSILVSRKTKEIDD